MTEPAWGVKRRCNDCEARFYDLGRDPIHCPKCGAKFVVTPVSAPRPAASGGRRSRSFDRSYLTSSTIDSMAVPPADLDSSADDEEPDDDEEVEASEPASEEKEDAEPDLKPEP